MEDPMHATSSKRTRNPLALRVGRPTRSKPRPHSQGVDSRHNQRMENEVGAMAAKGKRLVRVARLMAFLAAAAITLVACGDDDQPASEKDGYDSARTPCEAPQLSGANSDTAPVDTCDAPANRNFSDDNVAQAIRQARADSFPDNVVANPQDCESPFSNSGEALHPSVLEAAGTIYFALYDSRDLITFQDEADVLLAISELTAASPSLFLDSDELTAEELQDEFEFEPLAAPALDLLLGQVPDFWNDSLANQTVTRLRIGADSSVAFDPLQVANALWAEGLLVRPNFIMSKAPGAQHSPANEPVPTRESVTNESNRAGDRLVDVDVLDSDFNADQGGAMSLSAGHSTFVAGVIAQSTAEAAVTEVAFETGDELVDHLTEWQFLRQILNDDNLKESEILNLSAGGYACNAPGTDPEELTVSDVPLATLTAIATLEERGTVLVAAAGNDGELTTTDDFEHQRFWPAAVSDFETLGDLVVGVKATDLEGTAIAEFSNPLPANAACAPGVDIVSRFPNGVYDYSEGTHQGNFTDAAIWSGTSFATPYVTAQLVNRLAPYDPQTAEYETERRTAIEALRTTCPGS